jgi:hypothetical protein
MSLRYGRHSADRVQPASDEERSYTTDGDDTDAATDSQYTADSQYATENQATFTPRPTFTATSGDPAVGTVPAPALAPDDAVPDDTVPDSARPDITMEDDAVEDAAVAQDNASEDYPATANGAYRAAPDVAGPQPPPVSGTTSLDRPLLSDVAGLRARWQQVQAGFVDDPREAVVDAADLIEQTTQALVGALRQRQRQLRVQWERGSANGTAPQDTESAEPGAAVTGGDPDTEQLRLLMQSYRSLFNQLCRP